MGETLGQDAPGRTLPVELTADRGMARRVRRLGFVSLGIFPNVHRTQEYETHGLKALFHPDAFKRRKRVPRLIPEVAGF